MRLKSDPLISKLSRETLFVMIIAELSTSLAALLDGVIIARFLSTNAIAAYGLTSPYTSMIKMLGGFFGTGTQIVFRVMPPDSKKTRRTMYFLLQRFCYSSSALSFLF